MQFTVRDHLNIHIPEMLAALIHLKFCKVSYGRGSYTFICILPECVHITYVVIQLL